MSLRKRCSRDVSPTLPGGEPNPMYCPTSPRCAHHHHYDIRVNGRRYRNTTGTSDKQRAKDIEAAERRRILDGLHGIRRQPTIAFKDFVKTYLETHSAINKRPSTFARDREIAKTLNRFFGSTLLSEITAFGIEKFKARRQTEGCAPSTVNRELMLLKGILTKAVEWKKLLKSPGSDVKAIMCRPERTRILTADEQLALLAAYDKGRRREVKPIIHLLMITAARISEILNLRWQDAEGGYLRFYHTKNGRERRFPITDAIAEVLASVPRRGPFVFTSRRRPGQRYTRILTGFHAACKDAGLAGSGVVIHTLRHTALSRMAEAGIDLRAVMEISGHQSLSMLERYTHPTEQRKAEALNTFSLVTTRSQRPALKEAK